MSTAEPRTVTADEAADYIIWDFHERGAFLSNLMLRKLLYHAQAWRLALHGRRRFDGRFEAWVRGPVEPTVFERFAEFRWKDISSEIAKPDLPADVEELLQNLLGEYGEFNGRKLERLACSEEPWLAARRRAGVAEDEACEEEIDDEQMREFYRGRSTASRTA